MLSVIEPNRLPLPLLLFLVVGCSSKVEEQAPPVASSGPAAASVDPNSLVEGEAEIFGMRLPTRTSVNRQTPLSAGAQIPWPFDRVASYFRERLDAESIEVGPRNTIFRHAKIKGDTSGETYNVVVKRTGHTAEVAFRKDSRPGAGADASQRLTVREDAPADEQPQPPTPSASADDPIPPKPSASPR